MSELYDKIVNQRGSLESLVAKIPGFKGYQDKTARRNANTMLREYITAQIQQTLDKMVSIEKLVLNNAGLAYMTRTRDAKRKIQMFHDRVDAAMPGYDGMWAQMKIGADELEKIYAFDEAILDYVERIDLTLDKLKDAAIANDGLENAIYEVEEVSQEALDAYALRDDVLTEISQSV
jgi:hypothetical protein